jgi:hypothetical protein
MAQRLQGRLPLAPALRLLVETDGLRYTAPRHSRHGTA